MSSYRQPNDGPDRRIQEERFRAVLPFVRHKEVKEYKPQQVTYTWNEWVTSTSTTVQVDENGDPQGEPERRQINEQKQRKVKLNVYAQTELEDVESFFTCFDYYQSQMRQWWEDIAQNQNNDATLLFDAFEHMLHGVAKTEWHDVLFNDTNVNGRTWRDFKTFVSNYILKKVARVPDAHQRQRRYMLETNMSSLNGFTIRDWMLRLQTMDRRLPYFLQSVDQLREVNPGANFANWWENATTGGRLSAHEMKEIILHRSPPWLLRKLEESDPTRAVRNGTVDDIVDHFDILERNRNLEHNRRHSARRVAGGRHGRNHYNNNNYQRIQGHSPGRYQRGYNSNQQYQQHAPQYQQPARGGRTHTYHQYRPRPMYQPSYNAQPNQGGRGGPRHFAPRAGGNGRGGFGRGGRFQPSGRQPQANPSQAFYYEEEQADNAPQDQNNANRSDEQGTQAQGNAYSEEQFHFEDQTEDELIDMWNNQFSLEENLFMDAQNLPDEMYYQDDEYYGEEGDGYYGEQYG